MAGSRGGGDRWADARAPPRPGEWFDGRGFFLNAVAGEDVGPDDVRLTDSERGGFNPYVTDAEQFLELPLEDPRCALPPSVNESALRLGDLNHDPEGLSSVLLTSFDLLEDVEWLQNELKIARAVPLTLAMHPWPQLYQQREDMVRQLKSRFDKVLPHFPGGIANTGCSVHAKLMLLEFPERLRVVVSSANLRPLHWRFRNEAVWVQDFPRARAGAAVPDVSPLLGAGGAFARTLAHFVCELLSGADASPAECGGEAWACRLARFDFAGAAAHLLPSRPGLWRPAEVVPPASLALRLGADGPHGARPGAGAGGWPAESPPGDLQHAGGQSVGPWRAALVWAGSSWDLIDATDGDGGAGDRQPLAGPSERSAPQGGLWRHLLGWLRWARGRPPSPFGRLRPTSAAALEAALRLGFALPREVQVEVVDDGGDPQSAQESQELSVRVVLSGCLASAWAPPMAPLLAHLETSYGLHSMHERLAREVWPHAEERHYVAMASALETADADWFQEFDYFACRAAPDFVGPQIVAPGGDGPVDETYVALQTQGRLVAQSAPSHAPGREMLRNHCKLVLRQFAHAGADSLYGWVYVGSHNLTKAAWGRVYLRDQLWVSNRELGVLLVQPRDAPDSAGRATDPPARERGPAGLFGLTSLPFQLPLLPASLANRDIVTIDWDGEQEWWSGWGADQAGFEWQHDDSWSEDSWCDDANTKDMRMKRRNWWWWAPT